MRNGNPFNLPLFDNAYDVEQKQYIRIELNSETALYSIYYPSGMFRREIRNYELEAELGRYIADHELIEMTIRYATEWRRIHFYPETGKSYAVFPNGLEYRGGAGNHTSFSRDFIFRDEE